MDVVSSLIYKEIPAAVLPCPQWQCHTVNLWLDAQVLKTSREQEPVAVFDPPVCY
jgi:hypothetical protein